MAIDLGAMLESVKHNQRQSLMNDVQGTTPDGTSGNTQNGQSKSGILAQLLSKIGMSGAGAGAGAGAIGAGGIPPVV